MEDYTEVVQKVLLGLSKRPNMRVRIHYGNQATGEVYARPYTMLEGYVYLVDRDGDQRFYVFKNINSRSVVRVEPEKVVLIDAAADSRRRGVRRTTHYHRLPFSLWGDHVNLCLLQD